MKNICSVLILILFISLLPIPGKSQASIAATGTNYTQDFNTLTSGTWTDNTTLTGWYAKTDATASITTYGANTGSTTTAGLYAFGVAGTNALTDRALGFAPSNAYTGASGTGKGYMGWRLKNNTGSTITSVTVTWTGEQWRKDNTATQSLALSYQQASTVTDLTAGSWTSTGSVFNSLINTASGTAIDGNATANRTAAISVTITVSIPTGQEIMLRWEDLNDAGNDHFLAIDDITVNAAGSVSCTPPTAQATFTSTSNVGVNQMDIAFGAGTGGNGRLVVVKAGSSVSGTPTSGTSYSGYTSNFSTTTQSIATGENVIYKGATSPQTVTGLAAETQYAIKVFEYNSTGDCYLTSGSGNIGTQYTLSTEPTAQPTSGFSSTTCTASSIDVTVPAPSSGADGYLLIYKIGSAPTGLPTDGNSYTAGNTFGDATVAAYVNAASTVTVSGLSSGTNYYFQIIPYNANSLLTSQTYNYLTTGTILLTNFTTLANNASTASTVETDATYVYTQNIAYASYQSATVPTSAGSSVGVHNIIIKDGGSTTDADALPTILTGISYTYTGTANTIRAAALFTTTGSKVADGTVGANSISFTGLSGSNVTAADGGTAQLILRVTFNSTVTDNDKLIFTVSSVTSGGICTSSQFAASNGSGAFSDNSGANNKNRIQVTADRVVFVQQPTSTSIGVAMSPSVTVAAVDANGNRDLDFTTAVTITSTGTLTGSPVSGTVSSGLATFSSLTHTSVGTYTLTATTTGLATSNTVTSSSFVVSNYTTGAYRTKASGGTSWATLSNWEQWDGSSWTATAPTVVPNSTTAIVYILKNFNVTTGSGAKYIVGTMYVDNNSTLTIDAGGSFPGLDVYVGTKVVAGSSIVANATMSFQSSSATFEMEDNTSMTINYSATSTSLIWSGIENFHPNSTISIAAWGSGLTDLYTGSNVTTNTYNGFTAAFGNIEINASALSGTWNLMQTATTNNLCHGNLTLTNTNSNTVRIVSTTITTAIGGSVIKNSAGTLDFCATSGTSSVTVNGAVTINTGTARIESNTGAIATLTIGGDLSVNNTSVFYLDQNIGASTVTLNLKGNLTVASGATLQTADTDGSFLSFNGTGTQLVNCASAINGGNDGNTNPFAINIKSGATVQLSTNNLILNGRSKLTVETGGMLDFNFNGSTPLLVTQPGSPSGSNSFASQSASTLKISSPDGITTTASLGNVQVSASNRTFDNTATFWYTGKANQVMGNAITTGSTGKVIIAELSTNSLTLTPSNNIGISNGTTVDALGGRLDIRKGIVVETSAATISGSGRLVMTDGTFQTSILSTTLPQLSNYSNYSLTGGTVELNGSGSQTISGSPSTYYNLAITNTGTKSVTSAFPISNQLTITNGIFDPASSSITGAAGVTMTGGTFRISKINNTVPELLGTATAYALSGGTVELYGSSSSQSQVLRGTDGNGANIDYYNIDINAAGANTTSYNVNPSASFGVKGAMTVYSPAVFQLDETDVISNVGSFEVKASATFKYGSPNGIKTSGTTSADGNIRISGTRTFPTTASYGFVGNGAMVSGNGLPSQVVNLYIQKSGTSDIVTLTNGLTTTGTIAFTKGLISTGTNELYAANTATAAITGHSATTYVIGNLRRDISSSGTYDFPVGNSTNYQLGTLNFNSQTGISNVLGYFTTGQSGTTPSASTCAINNSPITGYLNNGFWTFTPNSPLTSGTYDITLNARGYSNAPSNVYSLGVIKRANPSSTWLGCGNLNGVAQSSTLGAHSNATQSMSGGVASAKRTGVGGFSDFAIGIPSNNIALPVKLLYLTAKVIDNNYIRLNWATASETDNSGFDIERSANGIEFEKIGFITGHGSTSDQNEYKLEDKQVTSNTIYYYRLKQIDIDSKFEYSNIVSASLTDRDGIVIEALRPNPASSHVSIDIIANDQQSVSVSVTDMLGREVLSQTLSLNSGFNSTQLDLRQVSVGSYIVSIRSEIGSFTSKLTITR